MESIAFFSNKKDHKQAAEDIIEQARNRLDFKPDLVLFYATLKYNGKYQSMLDKFKEEFGDIPQIGGSVDGMIYPDDIHTDGAVLVLCRDENVKVYVKGIKEKGSIESAEKLAKEIVCKNGAIILHFPLVHVPNVLRSIEGIARGLYYSKACKSAEPEKQKEYAGKFAEYCDQENIFHLPPTIIDIFAKQTDYKIPIIGINIMHTQVRFNTPQIFANFKDIDGGIAALIFEDKKINAYYDDIFPNKGKNLEETRDIVKKEFSIIKEFKANFEKNILISLDGKSPLEAVENLIYVAEMEKEEMLGKLETGDYKLYNPYNLLFFNKKTKGVFLIGIGSYYPFELFPFFTDISDYSENVALVYELVGEKFDSFISTIMTQKSEGKFVFFCLDVGVVASFGEKVFEYKDKIKIQLKNNYFGILSCAPSAFIPPDMQSRNYLSESKNNIFYTSAGTNVCLKI